MTLESTAEGLAISASGRPDTELVVFAGPPTGPHYPQSDGKLWTTVGSEDPPAGGGRIIARVAFTDTRPSAGKVVPWSELPEEAVVVQGVTFESGDLRKPRAVTAAEVVFLRHGEHTLWPHWLFALLWPLRWRTFVIPALVVAALCLRRLRFERQAGRRWRLVAVGLLALWLLGERGAEPHQGGLTTRPNTALPLRFATAEDWQAVPDSPVDGVTRPGVAALINAARELVPKEERVTLAPRSPEGMAHRELMEANWLLGDRVKQVHLRGEDFRADAGYALVFGNVTAREGLELLFQNEAGAIVRVTKGAGR